MNVCLFADGKSEHVRRLAGGLVRRGFAVHIVQHKPVDVPGATIERFEVPKPGLTNPRRWHGRWTNYLRDFLRRFDVVNVQFLADWGFTPEILRAGCFITSAWGSDIVAPPGETPPSAQLRQLRIDLLRNADAVTACGITFARRVAEFARIEPDRVAVAEFGVDLDLFQPDPSSKPLGHPPRVGFFKGFREVYGPTVLVEAIPKVLARVPNAKFDLVGEGPMLQRCRDLVHQLGVDPAVSWFPRQPNHESIARMLDRWDVSVIPSRMEAFGVAALESAAMGVPVVASRVGGLPDAVGVDQSGILVEPESPDALADGLIALLTDPERRCRLASSARAWVAARYAWPDCLDRWVGVFEQARERAACMV